MRISLPLLSTLLCAALLVTGCQHPVEPFASDSEAFEPLTAGKKGDGGTTVPGHSKSRQDQDNNGYPDVGVVVNGHYTSLYAYDANGDWYWDLGDGRVQGTVGGVDDLDAATLTTCDYVNNYRATFENDPFMDSGWIQNHINCSGYDDNNHYNYLIVHETDPRYKGNPDWAIWGTWEYHVLTVSGFGNLVRPEHHVGGS